MPYTEQLADAICEQIAEGTTLRDICRQEGMPGYVTVYQYLKDHPEFAERFARAREIGETAIADDCLSIADGLPERTPAGTVDAGDIQRKKLQIWTRMQLLAKWNPRKWGDKVEQTVQGPNGGPVQVAATHKDVSELGSEDVAKFYKDILGG